MLHIDDQPAGCNQAVGTGAPAAYRLRELAGFREFIEYGQLPYLDDVHRVRQFL